MYCDYISCQAFFLVAVGRPCSGDHQQGEHQQGDHYKIGPLHHLSAQSFHVWWGVDRLATLDDESVEAGRDNDIDELQPSGLL